MKNDSPFIHLGLALFLSFAFSLIAWVGFDVFHPIGIWTASAGAGLAGAMIGYLTKRNLAVTALATLAIRAGIFFAATAG